MAKGRKTGGRQKGSKNKKFYIPAEEFEQKGIFLMDEWYANLPPVVKKDDGTIIPNPNRANAIADVFPYINSKPTQDVNLDTDVDQLVIVLNHGEDKKKHEAKDRTSRTPNKGV